jgi:hypothetical protein
MHRQWIAFLQTRNSRETKSTVTAQCNAPCDRVGQKSSFRLRSYCSPFVDQLDRDGLRPPLHHDSFSLGRPIVDFGCVVSSFLVWRQLQKWRDKSRARPGWREGFLVERSKDPSLCDMAWQILTPVPATLCNPLCFRVPSSAGVLIALPKCDQSYSQLR